MDEADRLERIAAIFAKRDVKFVIIGGWAVEAQGYELGYKTDDIDFTPDLGPDNLDRLSAALYDLDAKIRVDDQSLAFNHSGESLGRARVWNLTCEDGDFDLTFEPSGLGGYRELLKSSRSWKPNSKTATELGTSARTQASTSASSPPQVT